MFRRSANKMISREGWRVETLNRGAVRYVDRTVSLRMGAERLSGNVSFLLYPSSVTYDFFSRRKNLTTEALYEIADRIRQAFDFFGMKIEIDF